MSDAFRSIRSHSVTSTMQKSAMQWSEGIFTPVMQRVSRQTSLCPSGTSTNKLFIRCGGIALVLIHLDVAESWSDPFNYDAVTRKLLINTDRSIS